MLSCGPDSSAKRKYTQRALGVMASYIGTVFASTYTVRHWHPQGWHLLLAAALPTIPIVCLAFVVARYLREEKDEYQRYLTVLSFLWATAVTLAISVFSGFLQSYGSTVELPAFTEFIVFWITVALTRAVQSIRNRGGADE